MYPRFTNDIVRMNAMYELDTITPRGSHMAARLEAFDSILSQECDEIEDIRNKLRNGTTHDMLLDVRVELADLLGDIIVYCASEAERWNIPLAQVLDTIMQSNFSKLGADGKPIKDERGKFLKGPNYWKPEPAIRQLLEAQELQQTATSERIVEMDMTAIVSAALTPKMQKENAK